MITYFFLIFINFLISVILSPFNLLPNATIDANILTGIATAGQYTAILDIVLPITTIFTIIPAYVIIESFIFTYKLIMWIIKKIPTIN